ncbi:MAG: hypothetical protein ACR2FH_03795 [Caulobacteraceae bacterium]
MADNSAGVRQLTIDNQLQYVDIAAVIDAAAGDRDSLSRSEPLPASTWGGRRANIMKNSAAEEARISRAIAYFYRTYYITPDSPSDHQHLSSPVGAVSTPANGTSTSSGTPSNREIGALMRNDIQDHLIAASNVRCQRWKSFFSTQTAGVGFWARTTGTVASALATAFTAPEVKSGFSAAASIASGTSANYNEIYLQQKTTSVIYQGIDTRRQNILADLANKRFKDRKPAPLETYSLSLAIADALEYHGACSLESGLQQAAEALTQQGTPTGSDKTGGSPTSPSPPAPTTDESQAAGSSESPRPAEAPAVQAAAPAKAPVTCSNPVSLTKSPAAAGGVPPSC